MNPLDRRTDRRTVLQLAGAAGASALLTACGSSDANRLVFLNWQDYIAEGLLAAFEDRTGASVTYETYASNDELANRLSQAGVTRRRGRKASTFDLIVPSDNLLRTLKSAEALSELPRSLSGLGNLEPEFRTADYDPGNRFSVPWATGTTGLAYSKSAFASPPTWADLLDPKAKGAASILDETRDAMAVGLWLLGEDPNTRAASAIAAAGKKLAELARSGVEFDAKTYLDRLQSNELVIAQAYSSDAAQAMLADEDLAFTVPAEGGLRWVDSLCVPRGAPSPKVAFEFIEYYLDGRVSASNATGVRVDTANSAALEFIPDDLQSDPVVFPPDSALDRLAFTEDLGEKVATLYEEAFATAKKG